MYKNNNTLKGSILKDCPESVFNLLTSMLFQLKY